MTRESDQTLRTLLLRGSPEVWPELYSRFGAAMFAVARSLTASDLDAEDAVQQTFLELYRARATFARADHPRAYVFRALHHAASRVRRRNRSFETLTEADEPTSADEFGCDAEADGALARALVALSLEHREVIALKIDGDLTFAEIAAALDIPADTAASRYRRALEKLRERVRSEP